MVSQKSNMFRKEALERAASPEQLDQLMQVVSPGKWLPLAAIGSLVAVGLGWSIFGRIPITVTGQGALVYPSKVVSFQSPSMGKLEMINAAVGDFVKKGEVLATIDQGELQKQLQLGRNKLAQLQLQDRLTRSLQLQREDTDKQAIQQQRQTLQQNIQAVRQLTPILQEKGLDSVRSDRTNLQQRLQATRALLPTFNQRLKNRQWLQREGAVSSDTVLQARQDYLNTVAQVNEAQSELKQLDLKEVDAQRQYLENLISVKDLQAQLRQLDSRQATLAQQDLEATINRQKEIRDVERTIAQLELQLRDKSQIKSDYAGQILEISATPGQALGQGARIGAIAAQKESAQFVSVMLFPVNDGKKVQKGMQVQVTPATVQRERFGGMIGTVTEVSAFPVTKAAALSVIGSPEVVESLMSKGPQIQVTAQLQPDPSTFSGFRWSSSQGPQLAISAGTTTSSRITIEDRAPITFVLPILRSWSGTY